MNTTPKAYKVIWTGMPDAAVFYAGTTRGRATYGAYCLLRDYAARFNSQADGAHLGHFRTVRAPEYDHLAATTRDGQAVLPLAASLAWDTREEWEVRY